MENATPLDLSGIDFARKVREEWKPADDDEVISHLRDAEKILIFGPGEAKGELERGTSGTGSVFNTSLKDGRKGVAEEGAGVSTLAHVSERVL